MALNIKQIVTFQLKVLRIAGFLEYVQQVVKLVKAFRNSGEQGVSQLPTKVEAVYTPFVMAVTGVDNAYKQSRASDYTQRIADEDMRRDNLYKQLVNQLKMYMKFTFDAEKSAAAELLWNILRKYNVDVAENYSEESGKLQQMLQELEVNYQAELALGKLGLTSLVEQLKTANEAVRTMMSQRNDERMLIEKATLANARAEADQAYRDLILALNASAVMDDDPARFDELISQVNELIKYYRLYVVPKAGKKDDETESQGNGGEQTADQTTPNPSYSGGETGGGSSSGSGQSQSGSGSNSGSSTGSGSSSSGSGQTYRLVIYKYGSGTMTVKDSTGKTLNSNDQVPSGSTVSITVVPVSGKVPTAKLNGTTAVALTASGSTYTGSFTMPAKGTVIEINSDPDDLDEN